jgi:hypothetical protein
MFGRYLIGTSSMSRKENYPKTNSMVYSYVTTKSKLLLAIVEKFLLIRLYIHGKRSNEPNSIPAGNNNNGSNDTNRI